MVHHRYWGRRSAAKMAELPKFGEFALHWLVCLDAWEKKQSFVTRKIVGAPRARPALLLVVQILKSLPTPRALLYLDREIAGK